MADRRRWSEDELLLAFRLYCRTPFGRLHSQNPEIAELAGRISRTPSAVAMKACNFASLDPEQQARGITALTNVSAADRELWDRFEADPVEVAVEAELAFERIRSADGDASAASDESSTGAHDEQRLEAYLSALGASETETLIRARRVQGFFRRTVLVSYAHTCALSGLAVPELLIASHIIPWKTNERRRADPRNGICLNALYDRAFDRGLIALDESMRVLLSPALREADPVPLHRDALLKLEGRQMRRATRFVADPEAVQWHREHVFRATA